MLCRCCSEVTNAWSIDRHSIDMPSQRSNTSFHANATITKEHPHPNRTIFAHKIVPRGWKQRYFLQASPNRRSFLLHRSYRVAAPADLLVWLLVAPLVTVVIGLLTLMSDMVMSEISMLTIEDWPVACIANTMWQDRKTDMNSYRHKLAVTCKRYAQSIITILATRQHIKSEDPKSIRAHSGTRQYIADNQALTRMSLSSFMSTKSSSPSHSKSSCTVGSTESIFK